MKKHLLFLWAGLCTLPVAGQRVVQPQAPEASYNQTNKSVEERRYVSAINLPVEITLAEIEQQLNSAISELMYEDMTYADNDDMMTKVWKRGKITATPGLPTPAGLATFIFNVPLKVWVKARVAAFGLATEKETTFEMNIRLATPFSIAPNWLAQTQAKVLGYDWVTKPSVKLGPVEVPITPMVERSLESKKTEIEKGIDTAIAKQFDLRPMVLQAWNAASQPYLVSEKYRTWLKITPVKLQMTPLKFVGRTVRADIGIQTFTETHTGEKPAVVPAKTIPDLELFKPSTEDFKVGVMSKITYPEAVKLVADTVVGQIFSYKKYTVEVKTIDVYGKNNQIVIRAGITGSVNGNVYFKGIPTYDAASQSVYLKDLDYDLETKSILAKSANWLMQGLLRKKLAEAFVFSVSEQLTTTKAELQELLNKNALAKGVILNGQVTSLVPDGVYLTPDAICVVTLLTGKAKIQVEGL